MNAYFEDVDDSNIWASLQKTFNIDSLDNSKSTVHITIDNSASFVVHTSLGFSPPQELSIQLGTDDRGETQYASCFAYAILQERADGKLGHNHGFMVSYVPSLLRKIPGLFLEPGNIWPMDTVGMSSHHAFDSNVRITQKLSTLNPLQAINLVLTSVVGQCIQSSVVQKIVLGLNILTRLAKTIKARSINVTSVEEIEIESFNVDSNWTKLISLIIYKNDMPKLSEDLEKALNFEYGWLQNRYDSSGCWSDDFDINALLSAIVIKHKGSLPGSDRFYMDNLFIIEKRLRSRSQETNSHLYRFLMDECMALKAQRQEGLFEPIELPAIRHNAGEFLTDEVVQSSGSVSGIRFEPGLQPMILPSVEFKFNIRKPRLRAVLRIVGDEISLESRHLTRLAREYQSRVTGFSILGNGVSRSYVPSIDILKGSMVANIAFSGTLGAAAGLWVLSHIIYGDLTVSPRSLACYAKLLAVPDGKLVISSPISPDIVRSIHSVTDGRQMFSVLHPSLIFCLEEMDGEWYASTADDIPEKSSLKSCFILSNRFLAGTRNETNQNQRFHDTSI